MALDTKRVHNFPPHISYVYVSTLHTLYIKLKILKNTLKYDGG